MFSVSSTLKKIMILLAFALLIFGYQQYDTYLKFRKQLVKYDSENRTLMLKIEEVKSRQSDFSAQYAAVTQKYDRVRQQLPDDMRLTDFKKEIDKIFADEGVIVVVQREAHYTRSYYSEVRLNYSLKSTVESVERVIKDLSNEPRLILAEKPRDEGLKNISFGVSIFSINEKKQIDVKEVNCLALPDMLVLPFFKSELNPLYQQYTMTCQALGRNEALYKELQRYEQMQEEIQVYSTIIETILKNQ